MPSFYEIYPGWVINLDDITMVKESTGKTYHYMTVSFSVPSDTLNFQVPREPNDRDSHSERIAGNIAFIRNWVAERTIQ